MKQYEVACVELLFYSKVQAECEIINQWQKCFYIKQTLQRKTSVTVMLLRCYDVINYYYCYYQ